MSTKALRGKPEPRLFTPPLRRLTRRSSLGYEVVDWAHEVLGIDLLPWQRRFLIRALELVEGRFRFDTVILLVARQSGKTTITEVLALWMMIHRPGSMVLGTSTAVELAREPWSRVADRAATMGLIARCTRGALDTSLWLHNESRYKVASSNRRGGRSLSVDLLLVDELREHLDWDGWNALTATTTARPDALTVALSNAGDDRSVVLNALRASALAGEDPRVGIFEWSALEGCELDDPDALAQANPALGHTIMLSRLESKRATMPVAGYRTEHLCQRVAVLDPALDPDAWTDCTDQATMDALRSKVALCLEVSPDLAHVTLIAGASLADGRVRVEVVDAWDSTAAARRALPDLLARIRPRTFGWFPDGPAAALGPDLRAIRGSVEITRVPEVCQALAEQITARRVLHPGDPLLTSQVMGAAKSPSGDGWRFTRIGAGHVDAVYACAGVVHLVRSRLAQTGKPRILLPTSA